MSFEKRIAAFLKHARLQSGLRYVDFAKKLGITHSALSRYELAQQSMTMKTFQQILGRLQASVADVFGEQEVARKHGRRG